MSHKPGYDSQQLQMYGYLKLPFMDTPHVTAESNFQHCLSIIDQLTGPFIFPQYLTGDIYAGFLQNELPDLLENVHLWTCLRIYY